MKDLKHNLPIPSIYATDSAMQCINECMEAAGKINSPIVCMALLAVKSNSIKFVEFENFDRLGFAKILWAMQNDIPVSPITDEQLKEMGILD
jgi:hypothetical protein